MKTILTTIIMLIATLGVSAQQGTNCVQPMSTQQFRVQLRSIQIQNSPIRKLSMAKQLVTYNCVSSEQVKAVANTFDNDYDRLVFAQEAYKNTVDKVNFYDVYDAFAYFSMVFRLHDFVQGTQPDPKRFPKEDKPPVEEPGFIFPDHTHYTGKVGCGPPLSDQEFASVIQSVKIGATDQSKLNKAVGAVKKYCFTTAQVMKLSMTFKLETTRLNFAKLAYTKTFDQGYFSSVAQVFKLQSNKTALLNYIESQNQPEPDIDPEPEICSVSEQEMNEIVAQVKKQSFNNTKITLLKQIIRSKQCFTVAQVKKLVKLLSFESSRLDMAKFAYDYTVDQDAYYQVTDVFTFDSSKTNLLNFLKTKQ